MTKPLRVLLVDLNNFARFPTIPVGLITAILRQRGHAVSVFSPLTVGVKGFARAGRANRLSRFDQMLRFITAMTANSRISAMRGRLAQWSRPDGDGPARVMTAEFSRRLRTERPDIVLVSAYTMYIETAAAFGAACAAEGIPLVVGGSYFNEPAIANEWIGLPGVTAVVAGEIEPFLNQLVDTAVSGGDLSEIPGVWTRPSGRVAAPPLLDLDQVPFADYTDFPWRLYPSRIVPMMTGRGCAWGVCTFCSDVTTVAGRSYRSRSPGNVMDEIGMQAARHQADLFVMLDLKLNSSLPVWHTLLDQMPGRLPNGRWTASVHVGPEPDNGLSLDELRAARAAGLVRMTTGVESGSQRVLNLMGKGTNLARTSRFINDAHAAGISLRTTIVVGYPGETADDLAKTAEFLRKHAFGIERVMVNRLTVMPGTRFHERLTRDPGAYPQIKTQKLDIKNAIVPHHNRATMVPAYMASLWAVLSASNAINRKQLNDAAAVFEGVL